MKEANASAPPGGTHSDLPHRSRQGCNFSLAEHQKSPRDILLQELYHLNGPNCFRVDVLLVVRDAILWDVSRDFLRFRQRADPLVIVEPASWSGLFLS